jgi:hypothetical protein
LATNSGPLSERRCSGTPFTTITSARASITFAELHLRSGRIIRHSLLCSSIRFSIRTVLPSCVLALTKSYDHTWLTYSGRSHTHDPSLNLRRR